MQTTTTFWKTRLVAFSVTLGLGISALTLQAQEAAKIDLKYEDLEPKLKMDPSPIQPMGPQSSYADMLEKITPSVVTIFSKREQDPQMDEMMDDPLFKRLFPDQMPNIPVTGAGVIISADGYVLTNNHVVEKSQELRVQLDAMNQEYDATLVAADPKSDVALIKLEGAKGLPVMPIGDSQKLRVGDVTFAIGNPFGLSQTVTMGIVSALGRSASDVSILEYANLIQTDAAINRGNSGGALVDAQGRLVGINTAIQGGMNGGNVGIGFAIPANMALDIVDRLLEGGGKVRRGFLGVSLQPMDRNLAQGLNWKENYGVLISQVGTDTPAARAGLEASDIIMSYEGETAQSLDRLRLRISNTPPDQEVTFGIFRAGKEIEVKVTLAELPDNPAVVMRSTSGPQDFIPGVEIENLSEENRKEFKIADDVEGVLVAKVDPTSKAADSGLREGQVILEVNQNAVANVEEALQGLDTLEGPVLLLRVDSQGASTILAIRLSEE